MTSRDDDERRRDTPRDMPRVTLSRKSPLTQGPGVETLEHAYASWGEERRKALAERARLRLEEERLEQQGSFLVGAVRAAAVQGPPGAPAPPEPPEPPDTSSLTATGAPLRDFLGQAEAKLARAREELARQRDACEERFTATFALWRSGVRERVQRHLAASPPRLRLLLRKVGATRVVLHLERVSGDTPVLLFFLLTGRIPSRHEFLLDDATDDMSRPPAPLYPEEGVEADAVRPAPAELIARMRAPGDVLPVRGFLPAFVPRPEGGEDFFRLLQRGAVMEVEVADGEGFRHILTREESERFAGYLVRLNLQGRLVLEVEAG